MPHSVPTQPSPNPPPEPQLLSHRPWGRRQMSPQEIPRDPCPRPSSRSCLTIGTRVPLSLPPPASPTQQSPQRQGQAAPPLDPLPISSGPQLWDAHVETTGCTGRLSASTLGGSGLLEGGEGLESRSQGPSACRVYTAQPSLDPDLPASGPSLFTVCTISLPDRQKGQKRGGMKKMETEHLPRVRYRPRRAPRPALGKASQETPTGWSRVRAGGLKLECACQSPRGLLPHRWASEPSPEVRTHRPGKDPKMCISNRFPGPGMTL